ncbi:RidA family protein [Knoellia koreensis]|uniref:RidA family protein n=1 Tax=Knoellia koreensis TaxID=2730921 RepID=A0A849HBQ3_9MICO|nr:RidA family protein [Knoellia sp. DB2414S]NNM47166.1 RidA family protein [Knoellia sp. DB2414S]
MNQIELRLSAIGLTVPDAPAPAGAYVPAIQDGRRVYTSGQLPMAAGSLLQTGKVGEGDGLVSPEQANKLAEVCALNALGAIKALVGDLERVAQVIKVVGFVASDPSFTGQPGVINGASDLFKVAFGDAGTHARSAVGVAALPLDAPVEVEVLVALKDE